MTTQSFIEKKKTPALKKGDKVVMHTCLEAKRAKGKIWTCSTDSYMDKSNQEVVFLDGFSGCFVVKFLQSVRLETDEESEEARTDRNAEIVASFMDHCETEGLKIPDRFFESYFGA